ncbi:MAG TPA: hypothetical protein VHS58_23610 [Acetobacteraceae bacterium]|jgi:hypothetical protein|nr:hypothetical protein [Acetobacteraceae bacterium]
MSETITRSLDRPWRAAFHEPAEWNRMEEAATVFRDGWFLTATSGGWTSAGSLPSSSARRT